MCLDMTDRRHPFGQHGHYGKGWSVWPGASRSNGSPEPKTKGKAFPSCDRSWGPEPTITVVKEERAVANPGPEDFTARTVQQAVNALWKASRSAARNDKWLPLSRQSSRGTTPIKNAWLWS
eukprot:s4007_g5.t1